ncbi:hypothetical protein BS50DRAFT_302820 [Corynespora cassiicola Philippines]|uniref:Uncharacterized protein n=1 Tax=Corynespora cassiicola Philippines TaxID=1448308 RepID=A0A2T2NX68_CORCC|nr:hypothetical protein BS50DRAFT_302820 [Corynespora cassiicola Philippines]
MLSLISRFFDHICSPIAKACRNPGRWMRPAALCTECNIQAALNPLLGPGHVHLGGAAVKAALRRRKCQFSHVLLHIKAMINRVRPAERFSDSTTGGSYMPIRPRKSRRRGRSTLVCKVRELKQQSSVEGAAMMLVEAGMAPRLRRESSLYLQVSNSIS